MVPLRLAHVPLGPDRDGGEAFCFVAAAKTRYYLQFSRWCSFSGSGPVKSVVVDVPADVAQERGRRAKQWTSHYATPGQYHNMKR